MNFFISEHQGKVTGRHVFFSYGYLLLLLAEYDLLGFRYEQSEVKKKSI